MVVSKYVLFVSACTLLGFVKAERQIPYDKELAISTISSSDQILNTTEQSTLAGASEQ